ncbi:MAG: cobalamin biosynthesis protein CbiX [Proteobacteria bacterium]|nr:cobalamin biosynthesis protein CbiX [Pseudomonadota bacterium]MBS0572209.1 cobalamin biosynthesis protein CbiX [Pseudomonadota bacterium]
MERTALIVAHGQPSDPAPAEADLARLAARVAGLLPGWRVGSATLADRPAVARALAGLAGGGPSRPLVFPFFMAGGWFTRTALPARLAQAGAAGLTILPPFGLTEGLADLARATLTEAIAGQGWQAGATAIVLAAHGSGRSPAPAAAARRLADSVRAAGVREVRLGFIEEPPSITEAASGAGAQALCLPLFVARWGHVTNDLPAALAAAGFRGHCLAPIGDQPQVPALIAAALERGR